MPKSFRLISVPSTEWLALKKLARKQAEAVYAFSQEASQGKQKRQGKPNSTKEENALAQPHTTKSKGKWKWKE